MNRHGFSNLPQIFQALFTGHMLQGRNLKILESLSSVSMVGWGEGKCTLK